MLQLSWFFIGGWSCWRLLNSLTVKKDRIYAKKSQKIAKFV